MIFIVRDLVTGAERSIPIPEPPPKGGGFIGGLAPDGRRVAYAVFTDHGESVDSVIKVVDGEGAGPRVLATLEDHITTEVAWLRDGKSLLETGVPVTGGRFTSRLLGAGSGSVVWRADTYVSEGQLSPDGRFAAVVETLDGLRRLSLLEPATGARKRLTVLGAVEPTPVWTHDGRGILFLSDRGGARDLWLAPVTDGRIQGEPEVLKLGIGDVRLLRVSSTGTLFYGRRTQGSPWYMAKLDRSTGGMSEKPIPFPGMANTCGCDWSPDSSAIAYGVKLVRNPGDEAGPCTLLVIRRIADGLDRTLSLGLSNIRRPRWSPDGKSLLVSGSRDGIFGIFHVDVEKGTAKPLVENETNPTTGDNILAGTWSRDGKGFYYPLVDKTSYRLMYRDIATRQEAERYRATAPPILWFLPMSVSSDGSVALMGRDTGLGNAILVLPEGGGALRTVATSPIGNRFQWSVWAADGRSIWASRGRGGAGQHELVRVPLDGSLPGSTGIVGSGLTPFPSPDGTRMLLATLPGTDEIWALDNVLPLGKPSPRSEPAGYPSGGASPSARSRKSETPRMPAHSRRYSRPSLAPWTRTIAAFFRGSSQPRRGMPGRPGQTPA